MSGNKVVKFFQKNVVMISGIGIIIATHWGWSQLQHNPNLVPEDKRKELPIIIVRKFEVIIRELNSFSKT